MFTVGGKQLIAKIIGIFTETKVEVRNKTLITS